MSTATAPTQMQAILQVLLDAENDQIEHDELAGQLEAIPESSLGALLSKLRSDKVIVTTFPAPDIKMHRVTDRKAAERLLNKPRDARGSSPSPATPKSSPVPRVHLIADDPPRRTEPVAKPKAPRVTRISAVGAIHGSDRGQWPRATPPTAPGVDIDRAHTCALAQAQPPEPERSALEFSVNEHGEVGIACREGSGQRALLQPADALRLVAFIERVRSLLLQGARS